MPCGDDGDEEEICVLDPHIYLDDHFYADDLDDGEAASLAEREAWRRVLALDQTEEFTTEVRDFYSDPVRKGATVFEDRDYVEI